MDREAFGYSSKQAEWENYWSSVRTSLAEKLIQVYKSRWGYKQFASRVSFYWSKGRILEVGAGLAYVSRLLAKQSDASVFALDYNLDICRQASLISQKENILIRFIQGDIGRLPFLDDSFEIVMSTGVLEHFEEEEILRIIAEMRRVGRIVISNLPQRRLSWKINWALRRFLGSSLDPHQKLYRPEDMVGLFQKVGFKNIDVTTINFGSIFPYISLTAIK